VNLQNLRGKLLLSLLLGIAVFAGLSIYGDFTQIMESFREFNWALLPLILILTTGNYAFRFVKWQYYLRLIGVEGLSRWDSFLVFFSGLGMVITPGKMGEWIKSYLLREVHGTPAARSAPILIAERLTDSIALVIIASAGVFIFGDMWQVFIIVAAGCGLFIAVVQHRPTSLALLRFGGRLPIAKRFVPQMEEFYESAHVLLKPRAVIAMGSLSTLSWFFEVLGFYFTMIGLGLDHSTDLLLKSAFILPISTLASALLFTPGGLIVAEASLTGLSEAMLGLTASEAVVGTLIIRFGTLWFGVIVGLICFAILSRRLSLEGKLEPDVEAVLEEAGEPPPEPAVPRTGSRAEAPQAARGARHAEPP
jgi:uncharacterized protein (TIRG00374 family)